MLTVPESVDPTLLRQLRQHILAKYGQAMLDAISPRREPGPATVKLAETLAMNGRAPDFAGCITVAIWTDGGTAAGFLREVATPAPCPDTDEWRPKG